VKWIIGRRVELVKLISDVGMRISDYVFGKKQFSSWTRVRFQVRQFQIAEHKIRNPHSEIRNLFLVLFSIEKLTRS